MLQLAKLSESAENTLFQAIQDGHCNLFPKASLPKMSLVQRARDATADCLSKMFGVEVWIASHFSVF